MWACACASSESSIDMVKRHHFLLRDRLDMDKLDHAVMRGDGHFLCPRNGKVAIQTKCVEAC